MTKPGIVGMACCGGTGSCWLGCCCKKGCCCCCRGCCCCCRGCCCCCCRGCCCCWLPNALVLRKNKKRVRIVSQNRVVARNYMLLKIQRNEMSTNLCDRVDNFKSCLVGRRGEIRNSTCIQNNISVNYRIYVLGEFAIFIKVNWLICEVLNEKMLRFQIYFKISHWYHFTKLPQFSHFSKLLRLFFSCHP